MTKDTMKDAAVAGDSLLFDDWFDAIEDGVRAQVRGFIETMLEEELSGTLSRPHYGRGKPNGDGEPPAVVGVRHGHRKRGLTGTFGRTEISVPRARLMGVDGRTREWRSASLRAYQRRTRAADALIAGAYLSGTNTRRVRRALAAVFAGPIGKDVVSRAWRRVRGDWDAWNARPLGEEPIVRLILDGTVVRVRLDKRATSISLLVALGVRADAFPADLGRPGDRPIATYLARSAMTALAMSEQSLFNLCVRGRSLGSGQRPSPRRASQLSRDRPTAAASEGLRIGSREGWIDPRRLGMRDVLAVATEAIVGPVAVHQRREMPAPASSRPTPRAARSASHLNTAGARPPPPSRGR